VEGLWEENEVPSSVDDLFQDVATKMLNEGGLDLAGDDVQAFMKSIRSPHDFHMRTKERLVRITKIVTETLLEEQEAAKDARVVVQISCMKFYVALTLIIIIVAYILFF
jgi:hypothetical protein